MRRVYVVSFAASMTLGLSCSGDPAGIKEVPVEVDRVIESLESEVRVLRAELSVPHIYAESALDLARVQGFVMAQDRYVQIELSRRFGAGTLSEVLGELGVPIDAQARGQGMREVAQRTWDQASPDLKARFDAFAEGINAYIATVQRKQLPTPEEIEIVGGLIELSDPTDAMQPMTGFDVAAVAAVLMSRLGYETTDIDRAAIEEGLEGMFMDGPLADLRRAGIHRDVFDPVAPVHGYSQTQPGQVGQVGRGLRADVLSQAAFVQKLGPKVAPGLLKRFQERLHKFDGLLQRPRDEDFGSNAWAVSSAGLGGQGSIMANDGHLPLTVPSLFYQMCLDTEYLGGEDYSVCGLFFPGLPLLAVGTNGKVAWGQTYLDGDVTDWYVESIVVGADGQPSHSMFQGAQMALEKVDEVYRVPDDGGFNETTIGRWTTFDGRWLVVFEGEVLTENDPGVIFSFGEWVRPMDTDGDGTIQAISFDWTALDMGQTLAAVDGFGRSQTVEEFQAHTKKLVGYAQNIIVADKEGDIMYTGYNALPCRTDLMRGADGGFAPGQNPRRLLDGNQVGSFELGLSDSGEVRDDVCAVPFAAGPRSVTPQAGYVLTANHDPLGHSLDDVLGNDAEYIGGTWALGFRAKTIDDALKGLVEGKSVTPQSMAQLQADHRSPLGLHFVPALLSAIEAAKALESNANRTEAQARLWALYEGDRARIDAAQGRLSTWIMRGGIAESGVDTFYASYTAEQKTDAVATMIANAWLRQLPQVIFADEGADIAFSDSRDRTTFRALDRMIFGRGEGNPKGLASFNPETNESAFFDKLDTVEIETSEEALLTALIEAMTDLASNDRFGTDNMDEWLWGLQHQVRFVPLLEEVGASNPLVGLIAFKFGLTTELLPLAESLPANDPRADLTHFPRDGDFFSVDAANPGLNKDDYTYSAGPVMRMVIRLSDDGVEGHNILPGGQSGLLGSPHFGDQAALWLGNETIPMRYEVEEAVEGASAAERFAPTR